jgi:hypothetical protein
MFNRSQILAVALVLTCFHSHAQNGSGLAASPQAVPEPAKLFDGLIPGPLINDNECEIHDKLRVAALGALGFDVDELEEARLVYEDIDGDGVPEALLTLDRGGAAIDLVVMKRKGDQWYRLPSPPEFSCWCKYEHFPLDSFVELQGWRYPFEYPAQPLRLIFVRGSGGGTGTYERNLKVFALRDFELRMVFDDVEEERECFNGVCTLQHSIITLEQENDLPRALVAREFRRKQSAYKRLDKRWWASPPASRCTAYTWSERDFKFEKDTAATSSYCHLSSPRPNPAKLRPSHR